MAVDAPGKTLGWAVAKADYSSRVGFQHRSVEITADTLTSIGAPTVQRSDAAAERIAGILYNAPKQGFAATVIIDGIVKWEAGAAIASAGLPITNDNQGRCVLATTGQIVHGTSQMPAGGAGEIITIQLRGDQGVV